MHILGLVLAHPNSCTIFDLLEYTKRQILQKDNSRISMTYRNNSISKRSFDEGSAQ